ncbi:MAG TPA: hypothetical protein VN843_30130 [Anaerolineales bacterium]|nr:hypothetical protein [Anaerolineales bacterium]
MSNEKKSVTLGMPHGTATNRLRKNILFHLLKKHGENYCFRCCESIERVDDLSIEHKQPWEGISAELFWDLNNIAFSHLCCNTPHRHNGGGHNRKDAPAGMAWCSVCQKFEPVEAFDKNANHWNGLQRHCRAQRPDRV